MEDTAHQLLDLHQFADRLGVAAQAVRDWLDYETDRIPEPLRIGGSPHWPVDQVADWEYLGKPEGYDTPPSMFASREVMRIVDKGASAPRNVPERSGDDRVERSEEGRESAVQRA